MKLSNFYCETASTHFCEDPERGGPACIFAVQGNEDCIVLMTSADLNNLYIATREIFGKLGFEDEYLLIKSQKRMNELFGESKSNYPHLKLRYEHDQRSVVILYKGKKKEKGTLFAGDKTLTTDDLVTLINELAEAKFITPELKAAVSNKVSSELHAVHSNPVTISPGGPRVVDDVREAKEFHASSASSSSAFFQAKQDKNLSSIGVQNNSSAPTLRG